MFNAIISIDSFIKIHYFNYNHIVISDCYVTMVTLY